MSSQQYLFIGYKYLKSIPKKVDRIDYFTVFGRITIYELIDKYENFELYTIGEKCDTELWKQYWQAHKGEVESNKEFAEYQRLKAKFEGNGGK